MLSNFQFLTKEFPQIYKEAHDAEQLTLTSPKASAIIARSALEKAVNWLYEHDDELEYPYDTKLSSLIHERCFRNILKSTATMFREINLIRLSGNNAAHGNNITQDQSIASIKNLFRFLSFVGLYYSEADVDVPAFSMAHIPDGTEQRESLEALRMLERQLAIRGEQEQDERKKIAEQAAQIATLKAALDENKKQVTQRRVEREKSKDAATPIPVLIPESLTRKLYIDILLKDAGWDELNEGRELEYEVKGMPRSTNPSGVGYADYVLWGKDGKPLAVIEAKRTMAEARKGRHQAELYADCLEQMHGQRPVIFYTNGFETYIWDDTFYSDREVDGFYSQDELQLLIDRRTTRKDPRGFAVNIDIAGRAYQLEAIRRVAENICVTNKAAQMMGAQRESLLVMATGSGKTRTAAALVDMLSKCNWAKRVLFLADRTALVAQAKTAFNTHLPELSAIDLTKEKEDGATRLVFSTYPTILNKIDGIKTDDQRYYGVGHFDLIIIDEAHRSVYQKYKAIFDYFDAMLIGLTATPKQDIDHNTYGLFGIEDNNPTFAYELDTAVTEGFLVPPKSISVPLKFQREGVRYADLSDDEKREYEEKFGDPTLENIPEMIGNEAVNRWLFNTDTVDKALDHLMTKGIKVDGGDKLGKTIIFAKNHDHAVFIEERFNQNYPEYAGKFLRVIDNYETKAQDLLDKFTDEYKEEDPQIAVSVDMMDTGVDAPRVVNLVFFKMVKSVSKFWQMIGRGTRLCPNLFAPGEDKSHFLIFDFCQNFEYFDEHPDGAVTSGAPPLLQQIFEAKLRVTQLVSEFGQEEEEREIQALYLEELHAIVSSLDETRFVVRKQLRYVTEYSNRNRWENLSKGDVQEINEHLSHLQVTERGDDELARRFDMMVLTLQIMLLTGTGNTANKMTTISLIAVALEKKANIPQIKQQLALIKEVQTEHYWAAINIKALDHLRVSLRELIKYLDTERQKAVYTHFQDEIDASMIVVGEPVSTGYVSLKSYKDRVESYVRKNKRHTTIHKLCNNIPISKPELDELERILFTDGVAGSKEQFEKEYGERPLGAFVRSIVGLEREAVNQAFADFLQVGYLRADQMTFLNRIIAYIIKNGGIDKGVLFEPPFTDINDQGLLGVFDNDADVTKVVRIIDEINGNAGVA